jgi:hypothetical protein
MKKVLIPLLTTAALMTACENMTPPAAPKAEIRVLHAVFNAPKVDVLLNGGLASDNQDYAVSTGIVEVAPGDGDQDIVVEGVTPAGNAEVVNAPGQTFEANTRYEIVATGFLQSDLSGITPQIVAYPVAFDNSQVRLTVLHASFFAETAIAQGVDVYLLGDGQTTADTGPLEEDFNLGDVIGPAVVPSGNYTVIVTAPDNSAAVLYDSGTLALAAGDDLFLAAIDNVQAQYFDNKSPIALSVSSPTETNTLFSATDGARLRVVHNASDAPAVDVYVQELSVNVFSGAEFSQVTPFIPVGAGTITAEIRAAGTTSSVLTAPLTFTNGDVLTVAAIGRLGDSSFDLLPLADNPRAVATNARLRVVHGAVEAPNVDIYLTAGTASSTDTPQLPNTPYKANSGYLDVAAGTYTVTLYAAGANPDTEDAALEVTGVELVNGQTYTAIARAATTAEGTGFGLTITSTAIITN